MNPLLDRIRELTGDPSAHVVPVIHGGEILYWLLKFPLVNLAVPYEAPTEAAALVSGVDAARKFSASVVVEVGP